VKQPLTDDTGVDEDVIGVGLALDGVAVLGRLAVKVLIAVSAAKRLHVLHPEVVGECADPMYRLFETVLDLEAQAIQANDLDGIQAEVGAHQQARAPARVSHCHEANELSARTPQQIADPIPDGHVVLAIDRAGGRLEGPGIGQQRFELDLGTVEPGAAAFARALLHVRDRGDSIGLHAGDQVVVLIAQALDDLASGVVGIGDEVERLLDRDDAQQRDHLVEQGTPIAVGPHQPFVNAHGQRHGQDTLGGPHEHADCLHGVPHDVLRLGVGV